MDLSDTAGAPRTSVLDRLREAEERLVRLQAEAAATAAGERLPGAYLAVEVAGFRALVPAAQVREILRLVAFDPLPGAPPAVLGTFSCRGAPVVACDPARWLGVGREPALDAHLVVFAASSPVALVVDRVAGLVQDPELVPGACGASSDAGDAAGGAVVALCRGPDGVLPLLRLDPFVALAREAAA